MAANGRIKDRNYIIVDGVNSMDYGVWIFGHGDYNFPERDISVIDIPGRSGALSIDNGRFFNTNVEYVCCIPFDTPSNLPAFRSMLLSKPGYRRIEDTFHHDEYRMGIYRGGQEVTLSSDDVQSAFRVVFYCKPQRFLKMGERFSTFVSGGMLRNPTMYEAKPLIRAYGTGSFTVGAITVQITSSTDYTDIDCELQDAYRGSVNCNGNIVLSNNKFPVLSPGNNGISLSGITKLDIMPRFWTI